MASLLRRPLLGILIAFVIGLGFLRGMLEKPELMLYDFRLKTYPPIPPDPDLVPVVFIAVSNSFAETVREPFSRKHQDAILRILTREGAAVVGYDYHFGEARDARIDERFAEAMQQSKRVILPTFSYDQLILARGGKIYGTTKFAEILPLFRKSCGSIAHINQLPDADRTFRRTPPTIVKLSEDGRTQTSTQGPQGYHAISLLMADKFYNRNFVAEPLGFLQLRRKRNIVPLYDGGVYIPCFPNEYFFPYAVSAEGVLQGSFPKAEEFKDGNPTDRRIDRPLFRNAVVFIGQVIQGDKNADLVPTPLGMRFGAYLQLSATIAAMTDSYIYRLNRHTVYVLLLCFGALLGGAMFSSRLAVNTTSFFLVGGATAAVSCWAFHRWGLFLDTVPFLLADIVCYVTSLAFSLQRALRNLFQKESALKVLEGVEREITEILRPSELVGKGMSLSSLQSDSIAKETPEIALRTLLASLGISSGGIVVAMTGEEPQTIAFHGPHWGGVRTDAVVAALRERPRPLIVNRMSHGSRWTASPAIESLMAVPILAQPGYIIAGIFANKKPTAFSASTSFTADDVRLAATLSLQAVVAIQNAKLSIAIHDAQLETIFRLSVAVEYRDRETGMHIHRVSDAAAIIARNAGLPEPEVDLVKNAMPMHDIGKIAIPDHILLKAGKLTPEERTVMEEHTVIGGKMLEGSSSLILQAAYIIAISHQEKFDGSGYPNRVAGASIPVYGRIAAIADVFDALSSKRVYKPPMPMEKCFSIIREEAGKAFDPALVGNFLAAEKEIRTMYETYAEKESQMFSLDAEPPAPPAPEQKPA